MEQNLLKFFEAFEELYNSKQSFVTVTLVNVRGSAPQNIGARMIVTSDGISFGTIGGGKIESHCLEFASELLRKKDQAQAITKEWNLQTDIKMTCGGVVTLFFEPFILAKRWNVAVFGAGHVSQALCRTLLSLDLELTVIDSRQSWLDKLPSSPRLHKKLLDPMELAVSELDPHTFIVSVTMGHATDLPILKAALLAGDFPYVGAIGSETKARLLKQELVKAGVSSKTMEKFFCPIGEPIGSNSPAEIAISITAQCLKIRDEL